MRVVVLGAGGGVGRQVRNAAVPLGRQVVAAARSTPSVPVEVEAVAVDVWDAAGMTATPVAEADVEADAALATLDLAGSRRSLLLVAG
jgi:putative NADH-flavin reductase